MTDLAKKKCIPCEGNIPPFNTEEIHKYLKKINGWQVIEDKIDGFHLIKNFKFDDFLQSQEFINKVGDEVLPDTLLQITEDKEKII